jgi:hypothetical protein
MSISHDNLLDRLLQYAPWAAAALVGVCVTALVARVASNAGSGSEPAAIAQSAGEANDVSPKQPAAPPHVALRPENATDGEGRRTASAKQSNQASTGVGQRESMARRAPQDPQTPSSKSKLEMHGVRRGTPAPQPQPKVASKATTSTFIASSRSIAADVKSGAAGANAPEASGWGAVKRREKSGAGAESLDSRGYTSFFGIEARGQRFAYVLDRSGSMGEPANKPLRAAKAELLESLERLDGLQQFFLIFYNEDVRQFVPGPRARHFADDANKTAARRFVDSVQAQGGTRHFEALQRAINLRPDVIFLLTDGEQKDDLSADELTRLSRLNGGLSQIHVIQFAGAAYAGNSLVQLANENRGQHNYKNIREIKKER